MSTTLKKSLLILESLVHSETPRGISELAREINLNKSAVQRIFQTLVEGDYIEKEPDSSKYRPTLRLWELGSRVVAYNQPRRLLHPLLRYAAKISEMTVFLAWADFPEVIYLDKIEGEKGRANSSDPGQRLAMHQAASGRAILAFLEPAAIQRVLDGLPPEPGGDTVSRKELEAELSHIRASMYAGTERGSTSRVASIAAPIWGPGPTPVASIVLTSDAQTLPKSDFDRIGAIAINVAQQGTRVLGGTFPVTGHEAP